MLRALFFFDSRPLPMTNRTFFSFVGSVLLIFGFATAPVQAQEWRQEVQLIALIGYQDPLHVFTDSLSNALARNPQVQVRRKPTDTVPMSFGELREELYADGVDLNSATHVFIRYQFNLQLGSAVIETIKDLYFIYRGNETRADLPLLHVSAREPVVNDLILHSGIPSLANMEVVNTFREMLAFPHLNNREETAMVEIAGRPLRADDSPHQRTLEEFLTEHMNIGGGSYVLSMPQPMMADKSPAADSTVNVTVLPEQQ